MQQSPSVKKVNTSSEFNLVALLAAVLGAVIGGLIVLLLLTKKRGNMSRKEQSVLALFDSATDVLDALATAAVVVDADNVLLRSTAGANVFGMVQNRILTQLPLLELVDRVRSTGVSESFETSMARSSRTDQVWIHARAAKMGERFVLLLIEDRTESKRLDDTRRDFVANISHELKTPIGAIGLLSEALIDAIDDPDMVKKFAGNLQRESRRLAELVQDIIELSRLQSSEVLDNAVQIDLTEVIAEAVDRNQVLADAKNVKIAAKADFEISVFGDREQLNKAVKNLVENAILYSGEGSLVGVGLSQSGRFAEIAVTDSGLGISKEDQGRVFERFYRVDPSRSRETGGTGLGLSIVKHIAMNHLGEVKLFSQPGLGSTFTLRIPLAQEPENTVDGSK